MSQDEKKPGCAEITGDLLADYADGTLGEEQRRKVEKHLEGCESCRIRAEEIKIITGALREDSQLNEDIPVPESVDRAVFATIREVAGRQRARSSWLLQKRFLVISSAAACVLLVVIIGLLLVPGPSYQRAGRTAMDMQKGGKYERYAGEAGGISTWRTLREDKDRPVVALEEEVVGGESERRPAGTDLTAITKPRIVAEVVLYGDLSGDGKVDVADALAICRRILAGETIGYQARRDANRDGRIDVGDALHIINESLKKQG
jgi:hypothetical protein